MTVDERLDLHCQLGKAVTYVRQGIKLLCLEDQDRFQKQIYTEEDVSSWQQRYFELQEEAKRLHKVLVSKGDFLSLALHSSAAVEIFQNRFQENEVNLQKNIGLLNDVIEHSNNIRSDLAASVEEHARTISNLESEVNQWKRVVAEQQNDLLNSKEAHGASSWNFLQLSRSVEIQNQNSEPFSAYIETNMDALSQLMTESQIIVGELNDARKAYKRLYRQNLDMQTECQKKSEIIMEMHTNQERMEHLLGVLQNIFQFFFDDLNFAQFRVSQTEAEHASLKASYEELHNELEIQKYRNDALDEVSRELAAKVQSGTVVDVQKFQQLQQDKTELQSLLANAESKRDSAIQKLEESDSRLQKIELKCQALQESLDNDDQIRLKYRDLFKELEDSLSRNKSLKDVNDQLENSVKKLSFELDAALKQCSINELALQHLTEEQKSFKDRVDAEAKVRDEKAEHLQLSLDKQLKIETELRSQVQMETDHVSEVNLLNDALTDELNSTKTTVRNLQSQFDDIKTNFDRIYHENTCLVSQSESIEVAKNAALDMLASTKSQLMEAESREYVLNNSIESLNSTIAKMTEETAECNNMKRSLRSDLDLRNEQCASLQKELQQVLECMTVLKQQIDSLKDNLTKANLQHVEDAEQIETLQSENKSVKARLEKLQDMNKILQQDLPASQPDDSVISRERSKTKALSKQVAILKKKFKDLEKDCQRWKALYEKEVVAKTLE